jgi:hypothetical protein
MKTLIWSVAWGEYRYMLQSLVRSIKDVGIQHDILTFTDSPLKDSISKELDKNIELDHQQYWKFHYLNKLKEYDYDILVFIDSDHFFVRKPSIDFSDILAGDSWHSFLESPINAPETRRGDWWGVTNNNMVNLYREFGVTQNIIYNTNGGFWICKKSFIDQAIKVGLLFRDFQKSKGLNLPEEVAISVLSHLFSKDYFNRLHSSYLNFWGSEWTGSLKDALPDGNKWIFEEYMTHSRKEINPDIVHAMRSKSALIKLGKSILEA